MNRMHITTLLGLVPTLLCASCTSLPGAWYYQSRDVVAIMTPGNTPPGDNNIAADGAADSTPGDSGTQAAADACDSGLYFAVLNNQHRTLDVTRVEINGGEASGAGWTCMPRHKPVKSGQLLVLKLPLTEQATCAVPLDAELWATNSRKLHIKVPAAMPSALPKPWQQCSAPAPTCPQTPKTLQQLECDPRTGT